MSLSRRDAIKVIGLSPVAATMLLTAKPTDVQASEDVRGKVLIVGGGAGAIMALSRIHRAIKNPDITIIAPNEIHLYQPGQIFVAAGEMKFDDLLLSNKEYIPDDVEWIKDEVSSFDPKNNSVTTRGGKEVKYDYMVVATGVVNRFDKIKGLTEEAIGTNGIGCVYLSDLEKGTARGATQMWKWFNDLKEGAKTKKQKVIYTQPDSPIKCGGAPQKMLYLSADYLKEAGLSADYQFYTGLKTLFHLPKVATALEKVQSQYDTIKSNYSHFLKSVDVQGKKATFIHAYEKEVYDEDFDEYTKESVSEEVEVEYDFLHVVPPMSPPEALMNSDLISGMGWLQVDKYTLQHTNYPNVFGIGDVCGIPMGKTGGSARHHGPILTENLISVMKGKKPKEKFDGYTVCPLKTQYGKILMAEFNYKGPKPTLPFLDIDEPRWMWWAFDLYMLKPMYKYLMLPGYF